MGIGDVRNQLGPRAVSEPIEAPSPDDTRSSVSIEPGEATIPEVLAHVKKHPNERAAIIEAERAGKARKGLLAKLGADE